MDLERGPGQGTMGEFLEYAVIWFPGGSNGKESAYNEGVLSSIPGLGRSPRGGHGNLLQFLPGESPWTEEPGSLQSIGLQRVRHD